METSHAWMLLTAPGSSGVAATLTAKIGEGTHGNALRRVDVQDGSAELRQSAGLGARLAYGVLYREKYLNRQMIVRYETSISLLNVHGRSADLAFALAFAIAELRTRRGGNENKESFPQHAATGQLSEDGRILNIDGMAEKLTLALTVLTPNSVFIFPGGNERDLTANLGSKRKRAGSSSYRHSVLKRRCATSDT